MIDWEKILFDSPLIALMGGILMLLPYILLQVYIPDLIPEFLFNLMLGLLAYAALGTFMMVIFATMKIITQPSKEKVKQ